MLGVLERNETEEDFGAEAAVCSHSMAIQEVGIGFPEAVRSEDGIGVYFFWQWEINKEVFLKNQEFSFLAGDV